jgi:hypothetical protein
MSAAIPASGGAGPMTRGNDRTAMKHALTHLLDVDDPNYVADPIVVALTNSGVQSFKSEFLLLSKDDINTLTSYYTLEN